jgi:phenylacetate-CoA ligase
VPRGDAELRALRVAQEAAAHVPAYGRFLRLNGYDAARLRGFADFCALPVMDRASYIARYPLADRCLGGEPTRAYTVVRSSGTAGPATFWPRLPAQGVGNVAGVRANLEEHFLIRQRRTLLVVAAAMGPWAYASSMTQAGQQIFAEPDLQGAVVTPGLDQDATLQFVEQLSPHYDQTILASYPALVIALLEAGVRRGIDWPRLHAGVVTGGEVATEAQRGRILQYLGKDPERLEGFSNGFGASEAGGMFAFESRLCLLLRRLCVHTPALAEALFGTRILPSINQYNPQRHFLQIEHDEVLLTMGSAVPLIRYNTRDRGGLVSFAAVVAACRAHGYDLRAELSARGCGPQYVRPLPFLFVHGRSDAVILHGGNLYLDEVAYVLEHPELRDTASGNFELATAAGAAGEVTVQMTVELREGLPASADLQTLYERRVPEELQRVSARFRAAYQASQGQTAVAVTLVPFGTLQRRGPKQQRVVLPNETVQGDGG